MAYKLLVADDSVTIQRVIELTFADEDVHVVAVSDGQQAIDRIDVDPPDIVLADIDMPKRDGYEVAAYIKSRPQLAHIPVVLLTGAFEHVDQARAAASGFSAVLAKPLEPQMVINRVKQLLGKKSGETTRETPAPRTFPVQPARTGSGPAKAPESVSQSSTGASSETNAPASLDDYFDQLDAAFANIQPGHKPAETTQPAGADFDWISPQPAAPEPTAQEEARPAPRREPAPVPAAQPAAPPLAARPPVVAPPPRPPAPVARPQAPPASQTSVAASPAPRPAAPPPLRQAPTPAVPTPASRSNPLAALPAAKAEAAIPDRKSTRLNSSH